MSLRSVGCGASGGIQILSLWEVFFIPHTRVQVLAFYSLYEQCEQAVENSENWLKVQSPPASEPEPLRVQLERCQVCFVCMGDILVGSYSMLDHISFVLSCAHSISSSLSL